MEISHSFPAQALYAVRCGCDVDGGAPLAAPDVRARLREAWGLEKPARQPAAAALVASLPEVVGAAELASLAHEWGHALHAALASSTTQHLSGTRGATDVAELPSTALEALAGREKTLLRLFRGDGAAAAAHAAAAAARRGKTAATDAAHQLALAYFDLELHGPAPPPYFAAAEAAARRVGDGRVDPRPFADVAHVVSAPATYYAYAYDRRLAEQRFADLDARAPSLLAFLRAASEAPDPRGLLLGGT